MNFEFVPRKIKENIEKWINKPEIIIITGARQVGKTTIFQKLIEEFKNTSFDTIYLNLDDRNLRFELNADPIRFLDRLLSGGNLEKKKIVFIDEFQKAENISEGIKFIYDRNKQNVKFFLSGSGSIKLKENIGESLAGRSIRLQLFSYSFQEFLKAKSFLNNSVSHAEIEIENLFKNSSNFNIKKLDSMLLTDSYSINQFFLEYMCQGGYPRTAKVSDRSEILTLYQNIKESFLEKDIQSLIKEEHLYYFDKFMEVLAFRIGNIIFFEGIARDLQMKVYTLKNLASIMKLSYLIDFIYPFSTSGNEFKRSPKVYYHDIGFRNSLIKFLTLPLDSNLIGQIAENVAFNILTRFCEYKEFPAKINFWRSYTEVETDFVLTLGTEIYAFEVKNKTFKEPLLGSTIKNFIENHNPKIYVILNKDFFSQVVYKDTLVFFIPLWAFALSV